MDMYQVWKWVNQDMRAHKQLLGRVETLKIERKQRIITTIKRQSTNVIAFYMLLYYHRSLVINLSTIIKYTVHLKCRNNNDNKQRLGNGNGRARFCFIAMS